MIFFQVVLTQLEPIAIAERLPADPYTVRCIGGIFMFLVDQMLTAYRGPIRKKVVSHHGLSSLSVFFDSIAYIILGKQRAGRTSTGMMSSSL